MKQLVSLVAVSVVVAACPPPAAPPPKDRPPLASCAGICAIGDACDVDGDCGFRNCAAGKCAAPAEGPAPTGPVNVIVDERGGDVTLVTDERVLVELTVPAGALPGALHFTLTPHTPTGTDLVAVTSNIGGIELFTPAALRVTLPAGVAFGAGAWLAARNESGSEVLPMALADVGANVIDVDVTAIGDVSKAPALPNALTDADWEAFVLAQSQLPIASVLADLQPELDALERDGKIADAAALRAAIGALVTNAQTNEDPTLQAFIDDESERLCARYTAEIAALPNAEIHCVAELDSAGKSIAAYAQTLDGVGADCPQLSAWPDLVGAAAGRLAAFIGDSANRSAWLECECDNGSSASACDELASSPGDAEWGVLFSTVDTSGDSFDELGVIGAGGSAAVLDADVSSLVDDGARTQAFQECTASGDMSYLGLLATLDAAHAADIIDDAQHCASALTIASSDASGDAIDAATIAAPTAPATSSTTATATVAVARGGSVSLRGPIATLSCRGDVTAAPALLADNLRVDLAGASNVVVGFDSVAANQAATLLDDTVGISIDVDAALTALGIAASDPADFHARLVRTSVGCGGIYDVEATLFDVALTEPSVSFTLVPPGTGFGGQQNVAYVDAEDASNTQVVCTQTDTVIPSPPLPYTLGCGGESGTISSTGPSSIAIDVVSTAAGAGCFATPGINVAVTRPGTLHFDAFIGSGIYWQVLAGHGVNGGVFANGPPVFACAESPEQGDCTNLAPGSADFHIDAAGNGDLQMSICYEPTSTVRVIDMTFTPDP